MAQSTSMLEAVRQLRGGLSQTRPELTDFALLRFVKQCDGDVSRAMELLQKRLSWEEEVQLEGIVAAGALPQLPAIKRSYPHGWHGTDRWGRPVCIERLGHLDVRGLTAAASEEQLLQNFILQHELLLREKFPACSLAAGHLVHRSLNIIDMEGLSFRNVSDARVQAMVKSIIHTAGKYPEALGATIIINAPKVFAVGWRFVKPQLNPKSLSQIEITGGNPRQVKKRLAELVDPDELPDFLGGRCSCSHCPGGCLQSGRGPWQQEGLRTFLDKVPFFEVIQRFAEGRGAELWQDESQAPPMPPPGARLNSPIQLPAAARVDPVAIRCRPPSFDDPEMQQLFEDALMAEQKHMETLENWLTQADRWERKLGFRRIVEATPYFEAEQRAQTARRQVEESEAKCQELASKHEDMSMAVAAAKTQLQALLNLGGDKNSTTLPLETSRTHDEACKKVKNLMDELADVDHQVDMARRVLLESRQAAQQAEAATKELKQSQGLFKKSSLLDQCRPYFEAKWAQEERILQDIAEIGALRAKLADMAETKGIEIPLASMTLHDFELSAAPSGQGNAGDAW